MWDGITYPFQNFNDETTEVYEWISKYNLSIRPVQNKIMKNNRLKLCTRVASVVASTLLTRDTTYLCRYEKVWVKVRIYATDTQYITGAIVLCAVCHVYIHIWRQYIHGQSVHSIWLGKWLRMDYIHLQSICFNVVGTSAAVHLSLIHGVYTERKVTWH